MTINHNVLRDLTQPDTDIVLVVEAPVAVEEMFRELERKPRPPGLLSFSTFTATDDETILSIGRSATRRSLARARTATTEAMESRDLPLRVVERPAGKAGQGNS